MAWMTEYIPVFRPSGRPSAVQIHSIQICPASAGMTIAALTRVALALNRLEPVYMIQELCGFHVPYQSEILTFFSISAIEQNGWWPN